MHRWLALTLIPLLACGPGKPGQTGEETNDDPSTSGDAPTSGTTATTTTEDPTADPSISGATTDEATATLPGPTTGDDSAGDETTDAPVRCPEGQEPLAQVWASTFSAADNFTIVVVDGPIRTRADGRLVAGLTFEGSNNFGNGYLIVDADGEDFHFEATGFNTEGTATRDVVIGAEDEAALYVVRFGLNENFPAVVRKSAAGELLDEFQLPSEFNNRGAVERTEDGVVVAGDGASPQAHIGRYTWDGTELWKISVQGPEFMLIRDIARAPGGDFVFVGEGAPDENSHSTMLVIGRVTPDGEKVFQELLERPPFGAATAIEWTPAGQVVVLTGLWDPEAPSVVALALDDEFGSFGEPGWETQISSGDPELGNGWARTILVDAEGLTIPVSHHHEFLPGVPSDEIAVVVHRIGLDGAPISAKPLPLDPTTQTPATGSATRGACGELVMLLEDQGRARVAVHAHE